MSIQKDMKETGYSATLQFFVNDGLFFKFADSFSNSKTPLPTAGFLAKIFGLGKNEKILKTNDHV